MGFMERTAGDEHLSQISTLWTMLVRAHTPAGEAVSAQHALLDRYGGAVGRYLLGATRDPEAAAELTQEFAVRFLRGDFRRADPGRGRFRDYLKTALIHLVADYRRARADLPRPLPPDIAAPAAEPAEDDETAFLAGWRAELLDRTWESLAAVSPTQHAALFLRVSEPDLPSPQLAEQLADRLGKSVTAAAARKALQRSHAHFAELIVQEVARSLEEPTPAEVEAELRELDLLRYCRSALAEP
jgi:RNA polymerase sigma-70 factor (ECF subfamily)